MKNKTNKIEKKKQTKWSKERNVQSGERKKERKKERNLLNYEMKKLMID